MSERFRLGFVVNPLAGIGGEVALKGSDGAATVAQAMALGSRLRAPARALRTLQGLHALRDRIALLTYPGLMGEAIARDAGFEPQVIGTIGDTTSASDTEQAVRDFAAQGVDLILFAGGDGTARNICNAVPAGQPVLGIPAGVKIHSGVYAITPEGAAEIVAGLVRGGLIDLREQEVRDIDEERLRAGQINARHYGDLQVPEVGHFVQSVKQGGVEVEALVLQDIADHLIEEMASDTLYIVGPGTTPRAFMESLGLPNTLLGVDLVAGGKLVAADVSRQQILDTLSNFPSAKIVLTATGGQGHLIGRGNQQLSAEVLRRVGRDNLLVLATKTKLRALEGRPLWIDSNDPQLDAEWRGYIPVITGYRDQVLYPLQ